MPGFLWYETAPPICTSVGATLQGLPKFNFKVTEERLDWEQGREEGQCCGAGSQEKLL